MEKGQNELQNRCSTAELTRRINGLAFVGPFWVPPSAIYSRRIEKTKGIVAAVRARGANVQFREELLGVVKDVPGYISVSGFLADRLGQ